MTTTTDLIKILQKNEFGGVTKEPREISIYAKDENGAEICVMSSHSSIKNIGGGDGICGASLDLAIYGTHIPAPAPIKSVQFVIKGGDEPISINKLSDAPRQGETVVFGSKRYKVIDVLWNLDAGFNYENDRCEITVEIERIVDKTKIKRDGSGMPIRCDQCDDVIEIKQARNVGQNIYCSSDCLEIAVTE